MTYSFEAVYDAEAAARAERAFYVRSVLELRRFTTLAPPIAFLLFAAAGLVLGAPTWFVWFYSVLLALSIVSPIFFYIARPRAARRTALQYPIRQITLGPETVEVSTGEQFANIPWDRVQHVWDTGDYVLLVFGRFASLGLPTACLPEGAREYIRTRVLQAS